MKRLLTAFPLAIIATLAVAGTALGQGVGAIEEPTLGLLASAAGLATVVFLITNLIRPLVAPDVFDRFGPVIAVVVGIVLSTAYVVTTTDPVTGDALLQGALVGLFAGGFSQSVNTIYTRARG